MRDAVRDLRRDRWFSVAAIVTLGVAIGAATAVFSIVNGVLLKPLAFPGAERLAALHEHWRELTRPSRPPE